MSNAKLSLRIDLANGSRLGPGKIALLEAVARCNSISAAAREQGMSYRRAWLLIDDMNRAFEAPAIETFPGRSQGSGANVTDLGHQLIKLYRDAEMATAKAVAKHVSDCEALSCSQYTDTRIKRRREPDAPSDGA